MVRFFAAFFYLFSLISSVLIAENITSRTFVTVDQGWNSDELVKMYLHNSEIQRQWAWENLSKISFLGDEKILDFGCGDGKISAELARLSKNGTVLGLDVSERMIHLAQILFPKYAFSNLEFEASTSLTFADKSEDEQYDLICAFTVFHLISDPLETLKNLKIHLKASGKLLITVPTGENLVLYEAANEVFAKYGLHTPWKGKNALNKQSMRTKEGCVFFLKEAGYQLESIEIIDTDNPFYDLDDFITWLIGTSTATWQIPLSISRNFYTDLVNRMYELDPAIIDQEGRVRFKMPRIHLTATLNKK